MPTECPAGGFRCGTNKPIWLNGKYKNTTVNKKWFFSQRLEVNKSNVIDLFVLEKTYIWILYYPFVQLIQGLLIYI